jgi:hypothetical protein
MPSHKRKSSHRGARRGRGRGIHPLYVAIPIVAVVLVAGIALLATRPKPSATIKAPQLPAWVQAGGPKAHRAYTQAVAYRDELRYIPCYCGCENVGHVSVADCYIDGVAADGTIAYDPHAAA